MTTDEKRTPENDANEGVPSLPDLLANLEHTRASQAEVSDQIDHLEDELVALQEREFRIGTEVSKLLGLPREEPTEPDPRTNQHRRHPMATLPRNRRDLPAGISLDTRYARLWFAIRDLPDQPLKSYTGRVYVNADDVQCQISVRHAAAKLAAEGYLERIGRGRYRAVTEPKGTDPTDLDT